MEYTDADAIAAESGVGAPLHRKAQCSINFAADRALPGEANLVLAMNCREGDAEMLSIVIDDQVTKRDGCSTPVVVAHRYINALNNLDIPHSQLAQITVAKEQ
jgi:hypothetical protein